MTWSPFKKYYKCPACGEESAVESYCYPNMIVHNCSGKKLIEVGSLEKGKFVPKSGLSLDSEDVYETKNFIIKQIKKENEVVAAGAQLNNAASMRSNAEQYLKPPHKIFGVYTKHNQLKYMVLIEGKNIKENDRRYFSGYNLRFPPQDEGEEILKKLIQEDVLAYNPFPRDYYVN
jgi:hypothetical protein